MISGEDFLITGLQSWNFALGSNVANIAHEIAKSNRVLFVNYAFDRLTLLKNRKAREHYRKIISRPGINLQQVADNLWVHTPKTILESINQIGPPWIFNALNRINTGRFSKDISDSVKKLGFDRINLFIDSDFYRSFYLKEILHPVRMLYYIRDNMIATDYYRKHGERMEHGIMLKADVVLANSEFLSEYAKKTNPKSFFVGQGCDPELFNENNVHQLPTEVTGIRNKFKHVIGYIGALKSSRIDIGLLSFLAKSRPGWAIVLVGPEDKNFLESDLHGKQNVFFLGSKPESDLPSYIDFFDVAINPQLINLITIGNYPRKIDEYLAMGKPVVASRTKAMEYFDGYTMLASDPAEFLECIEEILTSGGGSDEKQRRIEFAKQHTWENNVIRIYHIMEGEETR